MMEENTVMTQGQDAVMDDASLGGLQEAQPAEVENGESLSSIVEEPTTEEPAVEEQPPAKEPGWIKQRVNKAVTKAVEETERRLTQQYEAMLAPLREDMLNREADELVRSGRIADKDIALEYLRIKQGLPMPAAKAEPDAKPAPARDEQGRFVSAQDAANQAATDAKADMLLKQANKIKSSRGLDVMQAFRDDPDIKDKVVSGEWDFYDVAEYVSGRSSGHVPVPTRSPNGSGYTGVSIAKMSDEQFRRLQENLSSGHTYDLRK